jgi:hypothetical protein
MLITLYILYILLNVRIESVYNKVVEYQVPQV